MYLLNISNSIYIYKQWKKLKFKDNLSLKKKCTKFEHNKNIKYKIFKYIKLYKKI